MTDSTWSVDTPYGAAAPPSPLWGLQIAWCLDEPHRVGQTLLLRTGDGEIGRGPGSGHTLRLQPAWVRGARVRLMPHLRTRRISRSQLMVSGGARLEVVNVGKTPLLHGGRPVQRVALNEGEVIELEHSLVLVAVRCALRVDPGRIDFEPGMPDAHGIVGESDAIWALRTRLDTLARVPGHVLLHGPSGAGKELAATRLRAGQQVWVSRSAATIPESLAAAELFGNRRDYPNAGMPDRKGLVGEADGGMLYLDEIGELPEPVQTALLRVLDDGDYQRVGEARSRRVSVRVVGATNQPLDRLRHDLVARFRHTVRLPGLTRRPGDIPLILGHLLRRAKEEGAPPRFYDPDARIAPRFVRSVVERSWTTHVRELDRVVWEALHDSPGTFIDLPAAAPSTRPDDWRAWVGSAPQNLSPSVIQACLDEHNGLQEDTWRALGLSSRHVLRRLIARHGLVVSRAAQR